MVDEPPFPIGRLRLEVVVVVRGLDAIEIFRAYPGQPHHLRDRESRKSGRELLAIEPFFIEGSDDLSIHRDGRASAHAAIRNAEDLHATPVADRLRSGGHLLLSPTVGVQATGRSSDFPITLSSA